MQAVGRAGSSPESHYRQEGCLLPGALSSMPGKEGMKGVFLPSISCLKGGKATAHT